MEFKPRAPQPMQVATPTPSATPPAQALRQSPGMMPLQQQSVLMQSYHPTYVMQPKVMPMSQQHHQQQQAKPYQPKRAVVSVDPVALATHAQNATGQPLQLAAQAATMQQQPYVYQLPPGQMQGYPFGQYVMWNTQGTDNQQMVRVVQGHMPQGAGMDPNQGASNQQQHIQQQLFMPQQPVPAHMQAQAMSQPMPQPAHTMHPHTQHMSHAQHSHSLPPVSQAQSSHPHPHPSPSPVQHMGGGNPNPSGPQLNHHAQGAPPTSGTPQSMLYGQQMQGMLPPQGGGHAMPGHNVSQGPSPTLHYLHNQMQVGTSQPLRLRNAQAGVSLSQAGGSGSGGPAPAHMQPSGHMNQPQHVVVMPQPPPQAINQAPLNPTHTHTHTHHQQHQQHQHAAAAAQFQQQLQGAANQLHANVGPNQHLQLQGGVSSAGMMPHNIHFAMQQGMQGTHSHHSHPHHHSHNQPHYQAQ
ncbi:hypothetical protein V1264_022586 [Littorina saxatilis]|uniref:Uncharacterized protein n=2 Tax=Littorina saxatilis TaxID=31220 RepID=A0AAN9FXQ4_9CAEN